MNITKEFIPYEQALALKELGFDEPCLTHYLKGLLLNNVVINDTINSKFDKTRVSSPLYQQAFEFFRKKYNVHMYPTKYDETKWWVNWSTWTSKVFDTYEEAELDCLKKLIEIAQTH
jgi:hypothetical protein